MARQAMRKAVNAQRISRHRAILVFCLVTSISASPVSSQQEHFDNRILDQKITLQLKNVTLMNALSTLSVIHRVPIGIEYSSADQNEPKLVLETESSSLNEILDSIVKHEPLYRWEARRWCYKFRARS